MLNGKWFYRRRHVARAFALEEAAGCRRKMADTDGQVAATVAAWERAHRVPVRDWPAIGREERTGDEEKGGA
jgi:hypothetical protein